MSSSNKSYVVCTAKPWNVEQFHQITPLWPGQWILISDKKKFSLEYLKEINPRYIFFPHWSWIVPKDILDLYECVCFHMTDLPYGRGGSPLQNLISRGHTNTKLTALRMMEELDAGPVYMKVPLDLNGSAQEIFERAGHEIFDMISYISKKEPIPQPQEGEVVHFKRRTPDMSVLPTYGLLKKLYDHIRMLDAETYPHAYIDYGEFKIDFSNAKLAEDGSVEAKVIIKKQKFDQG